MNNKIMITSRNQYEIKFLKTSKKYEIFHPPSKANHFITPDTKSCFKVYVFMDGSEIIYVGVAKRAMSSRINDGLSAKGKHGYHGYKFKSKFNHLLKLFVFTFDGINQEDAESIDAEIVYQFRRKNGFWPRFQTEIHFNNKLCNNEIVNEIYSALENS